MNGTNQQPSSSASYADVTSGRSRGEVGAGIPPPPAYDDVTSTVVSSMIIELDEDFEIINEVIAEEMISGNDNEIDAIVKAVCPIVIE